MKKETTAYKSSQRIAAIFMILALLWLTVSIPFVYAAQQKTAEKEKTAQSSEKRDNSSNPFANTTEEKAPSNNVSQFSEEYLHHTDELFYDLTVSLTHSGHHTADEYIAFHGELLCPPPNFIS